MDKYDSIDVLPLYNWDMMVKNDDYNWLIVGFDGRQKKVIDPGLEGLKAFFVNKYIELLDNGSYLTRLRLMARIQKLQTQQLQLSVLIDVFWRGFSRFSQEIRLKYIKEINSFGFKMPEINTGEGDYNEIKKVIDGRDSLTTGIAILKKELKEEPKTKEKSLFIRLRNLEKTLEYTTRLNPKEITLKDYIDLIIEARNYGKPN